MQQCVLCLKQTDFNEFMCEVEKINPSKKISFLDI